MLKGKKKIDGRPGADTKSLDFDKIEEELKKKFGDDIIRKCFLKYLKNILILKNNMVLLIFIQHEYFLLDQNEMK